MYTWLRENGQRGEKAPTPKISALLRKRPVVLKANFVLTKDRKRPYYGHLCGKMHREGLVVKRPGVLSKVQTQDSCLGGGGLFPSSKHCTRGRVKMEPFVLLAFFPCVVAFFPI